MLNEIIQAREDKGHIFCKYVNFTFKYRRQEGNSSQAPNQTLLSREAWVREAFALEPGAQSLSQGTQRHEGLF